MESIAALRSRSANIRKSRWLCAVVIALAAILLPTASAHATLPNQGDIDSALKELTEAEQAARDNIPGNSRVKDAEDALDAAKRANEDTSTDDATAKANAEAAEAAAQAAADALREEMKNRTSDIQKDRAKKYREALDKRRAARKKLKAVLAELRTYLMGRRGNAFGSKDVEDAINLVRPRLSQSEMTITPQSTAALTPFAPVISNVANDGQAYCTFGNSEPTKVALAPADGDGNVLAAKMLASLPLMAPGGVKVPSKNDGPAPKDDKPQGGASAPQGPSTSTPSEPAASQGSPPTGSKPPPAGANDSGPSTVPPPENPTAKSGGQDLGAALDILLGGDGESGMTQIDPPPAPPTPQSGPSVLDNIDDLLEIFKRERRGQPTTSAQSEAEFQEWVENWIRARQAGGSFPTLGSGGLTPLEKFILYHEYLRLERARRRAAIEMRIAPKPTPTTVPPVVGPMPAGTLGGLPGVSVKSTPEIIGGANSPGASLEPMPAPGSGPQINPDATKPAWERPNAMPTPADAGQKSAGGKPSSSDKPANDVQTLPQSKAASEKSASATKPAMSPVDKPIALGPSAPSDANIVSDGNVTLHFKATESVLQAESQGAELKTQVVKLIPTQTAELPKNGRSKSEKAALDQGHDSSPVTCTLDKSGACKAQLVGDQRKVYGLPANGPSNYLAEMRLRENAGGVLEDSNANATGSGAGLSSARLPDLPAGVRLTTSKFKIGNKTFTRFALSAANPALAATALATLGTALGAKFETDHCGEKKPGPPLGMEPASYRGLRSELPQARISLRQSARHGARAR